MRIRFVTRLSALWSALMAASKLTAGIAGGSVFLCMHALCTAGMGVARWLYLVGRGRGDAERCRRGMGVVVLLSGASYVLYSFRLLIGERAVRHHSMFAVAMAAFALFEIALNISESRRARRGGDELLHALRMTNLAASLFCLSLAQSALLTLVHDVALSFYNGLIGMLMGAFAALIGTRLLLQNYI